MFCISIDLDKIPYSLLMDKLSALDINTHLLSCLHIKLTIATMELCSSTKVSRQERTSFLNNKKKNFAQGKDTQ